VVIEHILETKRILKDSTQDADVLLAQLNDLSCKQPAVEVLQSTGIGAFDFLLCSWRFTSESTNQHKYK
jgi:hypothetical protein